MYVCVEELDIIVASHNVESIRTYPTRVGF